MHSYETPFGQFKLAKYPLQKSDPLLPFDSADKYLLNAFFERHNNEKLEQNIIVCNDNHGALTIPLINSGYRVFLLIDSALSTISIRKNLALNSLTEENLVFCDEFNVPSCTDVIGRVPKSLTYLSHLSKLFSNKRSPSISLGIMAKHLNRSYLDAISNHYGDAQGTLAWKKARLLNAEYATKTSTNHDFSIEVTNSYRTEDPPIELNLLPNVFAQRNIDIGARLIIDQIRAITNQVKGDSDLKLKIADLGCGNGILGLTWMSFRPQDEIRFYDDSLLAVSSAVMNAEIMYKNFQPDGGQQAKIYGIQTDCLGYANDLDNCSKQVTLKLYNTTQEQHSSCSFAAGLTEENFAFEQIGQPYFRSQKGTFDFVVCNPPFHTEFKLTDDIAERMFNQAKKGLKENGKLIVVGNRHLNYQNNLKRIFKNCNTLSSNSKFVVLESVKKAIS